MSILRVSQLGKSYRQYASELIRFARWFGLPFKPSAEHWVLNEISFEVLKGQSVGIIGKNGAGKSTLLKMITGVLQPSTGTIQVNGKIAAILELGMGFNPDLNARQNVYHALGLMGHSHGAIDDAMPDLEAFAEIGEYFDQPIRTYSSGMQMRVAFAVATAFRPDILIVDEALSVGDAYFQHKSFDRIREMKEQGTSLLIVSHDLSSIQALCDKVILLQNGGLIMEGRPETVLDYYNASLAEHQNQKVRQVEHGVNKVQTISGTGEVTISKVELLDHDGQCIEVASVGQELTLAVGAKAHSNIEKLVLGFAIKNHLGQVIYGTNTYHTKQIQHKIAAGSELSFLVKFPANLGVGTYSVQLALCSSDTHLENNYEWRDLAYVFEIANVGRDFFAGMAWLDSAIEVKKAS